MSRMDKTYEIHASKIADETLDGETIIIHLETGWYYSLNDTATVIWANLKKGHSPRDIVDHFIAAYAIGTEEAETMVSSILSLLVKDELIREAGAMSAGPVSYVSAETSFLKPSVEKYDDMREMLLPDLIHDFDQVGWPILK